MVHYVRFLRTPQVSAASKKGLNVSAVATITTDLGDAYFGGHTEIVARLVDATRFGEVLHAETVPWQDGMRAVKIVIPCNVKIISRLVRVHLTTEETISMQTAGQVPRELDVWSESFLLKPGISTEAIVERQLCMPGKSIVRMWEETGDSIARHIWDASLGFLVFFRQALVDQQSTELLSVRKFLTSQLTTRIKVLEVGAGCGIVGITLAQLRKSDTLLTDLEDAQGILQRNVDCAQPLAGSAVRHCVLGWGPSIDTLNDPRYDLVLVSDCIYNPDSSLLLVETLEQLSKYNPHLLILVGFKRRHDADDIFFGRMKDRGFVVAESCEIFLPHTMTDYDAAAPKVEMFVYQVRPQID